MANCIHASFSSSRQRKPSIDCVRNLTCIGPIERISTKVDLFLKSPPPKRRPESVDWHHRSPLIAVQVQFFGATGRPKGRVRNEPIQPRVDFRIRRELKSAIMLQDVARAKQPFVCSSTSIEGKNKKEYKAELNMAPPSRPSNSTPRPRATNPIRVPGSPRRSRARRARGERRAVRARARNLARRLSERLAPAPAGSDRTRGRARARRDRLASARARARTDRP